MSDQSSLKEGKQQTDEMVNLVAEESQLEPALAPPPPPLNPTSSSSILPPTPHDPSPINSTSASFSGDPIASQIAQLFSLVGRLSSENAALKAQVEGHSSKFDQQAALNARLSAENQELKRRDEEREKTVQEISKAFGSHWVWEVERGEGKGGKGRWTWSEEKYKSICLRVPRSKPPPSLNSLPVELANSIFSLLDRSDQLRVCGVSFRILEIASTLIYPERLKLNSETAANFFGPRACTLTPSSSRITSLLLPNTVDFCSSHFNPAHFLPLPNGPPIAIFTVSVAINPFVTIKDWSPLLRLVNPIAFTVTGGVTARTDGPTPLRVKEDDLPFLTRWSRLKLCAAVGSSSVLFLDDGTLAMSSCLGRCNPRAPIELDLVSVFFDGRQEEERVAERELSKVLARTIAPDPTRRAIAFSAWVA